MAADKHFIREHFEATAESGEEALRVKPGALVAFRDSNGGVNVSGDSDGLYVGDNVTLGRDGIEHVTYPADTKVWDLSAVGDGDTGTTTIPVKESVTLSDFAEASHDQLGDGDVTIRARVVSAGDSAGGSLYVEEIDGEFEVGEALSDESDGDAVVSVIADYDVLAYDGGVKTVGALTYHGQTSGAHGLLVGGGGAGATGTIAFTAGAITGTFADNEKLVVNSAVANGALSTNYFLAYDGQSGNFTVGQVVTGGTSGAVGTIAADTDGGATGILELTSVTGAFQDNEAITDPITGAAAANGLLYKNLAYDAQTTNFVVADVVWGRTSGAKGTVQGDTDGGATGTLKLKSITGVFVDNEPLGVEYATANDTVYRQIDYTGSNSFGLAEGDAVTGGTSGATGVVRTNINSGGTVGVWVDNNSGDDLPADETGILSVIVRHAGTRS